MPRLVTVLGVLSRGLDGAANVLGAVMPGPEQPAQKRGQKAGCTPCEARAKAREYLYGVQEPPKPKRPTVGRAEPARAAGPRSPAKAPPKARKGRAIGKGQHA